MSRFCWSAALLAMLLSSASASMGLAKPPDLPANNDVRCPEGCDEPEHRRLQLGWDAANGQLQVEIQSPGQPASEAATIFLDVWCPNVMPLLVQRICQRLLGGSSAPSIGDTPPTEKPPTDDDEASFRRIRETTEPLGMVRALTY